MFFIMIDFYHSIITSFILLKHTPHVRIVNHSINSYSDTNEVKLAFV